MCVINQVSRFIGSAMLAAFVVAGVGMSAASAQQPGTPTAEAFLANPGQLLQQNPNGGSQLTNAVQQLAVSDPSTFKALIGLLANASDLQKSALAQGLTRAAKIEVLTNQALAQDWESQIAAITDPTFKMAALNALGDVQLGAVAGAAGGAAGAGLGGPGGGPGGGGAPQSIGVNPRCHSQFYVHWRHDQRLWCFWRDDLDNKCCECVPISILITRGYLRLQNKSCGRQYRTLTFMIFPR